jgi:hypothetical protein
MSNAEGNSLKGYRFSPPGNRCPLNRLVLLRSPPYHHTPRSRIGHGLETGSGNESGVPHPGIEKPMVPLMLWLPFARVVGPRESLGPVFPPGREVPEPEPENC